MAMALYVSVSISISRLHSLSIMQISVCISSYIHTCKVSDAREQ